MDKKSVDPVPISDEAAKIADNIAEEYDVGRKTLGIDIGLSEIVQLVLKQQED
jgi:hypothetical protein